MKFTMGITICTIGHGTRPMDEFLEILRGAGVRLVVDVRSFPGSRRNPQFNRENLEEALSGEGLAYLWEGEALGGFRRQVKDSPNRALKNAGFRAYADHMGSDVFRVGVERLLGLGRETSIAVMCAERLPWRCHRFLLADFLVHRGARVLHLVKAGSAEEHRLSPLARREGDRLVYDLGETGPRGEGSEAPKT